MKEEFIISIICLLIYLIFKTKKAFHMLQQNYYDESNRYLLWIKNNLKKVFLSFDLALFIIAFAFLLNNVISIMINRNSIFFIINKTKFICRYIINMNNSFDIE